MSDMNVRWKVRRVQPIGGCPGCRSWFVWRIWDSTGEWDSDYCDWQSAVDWAGSPFKRGEYEINNPEAAQ